MMRRAEPLVVNIFVTTLTGIRLHEKLAGNLLLPINLCRTREERALRPVAFPIHVVGRHRRILNAIARLPTLAHIMRTVAQTCKHRQTHCRAHSSCDDAGFPQLSAVQPTCQQQAHTSERNRYMKIELIPFRARSPSLKKDESQNRACGNQQPACSRRETSRTNQPEENWDEQDCGEHSCHSMEQHHTRVDDIRLRKRVEIHRRKDEKSQQPRQSPTDESPSCWHFPHVQQRATGMMESAPQWLRYRADNVIQARR